MYIYTKKKFIEVRNEVKCIFLGRNDGVTLRTGSCTNLIKGVRKGVPRMDSLVCNGINSMFSCLF